jgi:hypothetical protein
MTVDYSEDAGARSIELRVSGRVTQEDWDSVQPRFEAFMTAHGTIRLLEIVESLEGIDPKLIWEGVRFDMKAIPRISRCAVVTDIGWMNPLVRTAGAMMPMRLRTFPLAELAAARAWLRDDDQHAADGSRKRG